jgi:hypothetical protein
LQRSFAFPARTGPGRANRLAMMSVRKYEIRIPRLSGEQIFNHQNPNPLNQEVFAQSNPALGCFGNCA